MSSFTKNLSANCIKCGSFCDPSLFCEICERNARFTITELCKRYNTKLHPIRQFLFELFLEFYKCSYFVNNYHRTTKSKQKSVTLETDFRPLRNSQYFVMRTFASQMSLQNGFEEEPSYSDSESESDCKNLNSTGRDQMSFLSQNSSSDSHYTQHSAASSRSSSIYHEYAEINVLCKGDTASLHGSNFDVTSNLSPAQQSQSISCLWDTPRPVSFNSMLSETEPCALATPEPPSVPHNSFIDVSSPVKFLNNSDQFSDGQDGNVAQQMASTGVSSNAVLNELELDQLFNFDQDGFLFSESRNPRSSVVITENAAEKIKVPSPMTPQPERRKFEPNRASNSVKSNSYRSRNCPPPSRSLAASKQEDPGLFKSLVRLWSKKKDSATVNQDASDGLLDPDFLIDNTIRIYFRCRQKLHGNTLSSNDCIDIRQELYNKLKDLRVVLEGQSNDLDEISCTVSIIVILLTKLYQRTLSKHEMSLVKAISDYVLKKCIQTAFRMRSLNQRKTELFRKISKVLDREL